MNLSIAPFTMASYDDVIALWRQCEGIGLSDADSRESVGSYLERNPGMSFVARTDDGLVGAVLAGHDGRRGYIHHLAIHPASRRQGIGRRLAGKCLDALKVAGIRKCHIFIFDENSAGKAFWKSIGWTFRTDIRVMSVALECADP